MASIIDIDPIDSGLGAAAGIMGRLAAPSRMPVSLGSILGQAGGAYQAARDQALSRKEELETNKEVRLQRAAEIAERVKARQDAMQKQNAFTSILRGMQESGQPLDEVSILGAGMQSGAFSTKDITDWHSKVLERKAKREQDLEVVRMKLADEKRSEEQKKQDRLEYQQKDFENKQFLLRLAATIKGDKKGEGDGQGKAPSGYRWKEGHPGVLEAIPGGPATVMTPEQSGKKAMTEQAILDVGRAEKVLFDENGKLRRGVIAASKAPMGGVGEEPRLVNSYIKNAVSAKYRLETGAAGNQQEEANILSRFMPNLLDNDKTAKDKLDRLREFMNMSLSDMKNSGLVDKGRYSSEEPTDNRKPWEKRRGGQ